MTPLSPPSMNMLMKPSANSRGVLNWIEPPQRVASQLKILTPVGTPMAMVAPAKAAVAQAPRPVVNMWCAHTPNPRKAMTAPANTTVV